MRAQTITALAAVAAALAAANAAVASVPAKKPKLIDPQRGTVGAMRVGDPAIKFAFGWAPPDSGMSAQGDLVPEPFQSWRNSPNPPWAIVSFTSDDQQHASAIFYRGLFKTTKGDTNGTPLSVVFKHWPTHSPPATYSPLALSGESQQLLRVQIGSADFFFSTKKLLVGIQVGDGTASRWINWKR
jgi:hypothetical protein